MVPKKSNKVDNLPEYGHGVTSARIAKNEVSNFISLGIGRLRWGVQPLSPVNSNSGNNVLSRQVLLFTCTIDKKFNFCQFYGALQIFLVPSHYQSHLVFLHISCLSWSSALFHWKLQAGLAFTRNKTLTYLLTYWKACIYKGHRLLLIYIKLIFCLKFIWVTC